MSDTTTTRRPPVAFRATDTEERLTARARRDTSLGQVAKRDLDRYHELLAASLRTVASTLTRGEKLALCALSNGILWDVATAGLVWAEVADTDPADFERWGADRDELVRKLRGLTLTERLALVDALERFWLLPAEGRGTHDDALAAVGLAARDG